MSNWPRGPDRDRRIRKMPLSGIDLGFPNRRNVFELIIECLMSIRSYERTDVVTLRISVCG